MRTARVLGAAAATLCLSHAAAQDRQPPKPVLYVIATSHLDSQWNWTVQDSIRQFVPSTFFENFKRFEQFPHYTFNYEGVIHYMWFKEYFPESWPTVQKYVAQGRWRLAGSWIDAVDTNVPSPESLMRQALYGQRFFRQEFGKVSRDVFLPDCFGFGFALPSIAAHSGLTAFSTQKLTWGSSYGIPFPVGRWRGVDGSEIVAALNPGDYVTKIRSDISTDPKWSNDLTSLGNGRQVGFRFFGVGDIGGAPDVQSVEWLEKSIVNPQGKLEIRNTSADQLSQDLSAAERAALPVYEGELTMKTHGVGCYTSQAAMKRFNRKNELLADSAERAAVTAEWLAGLPYPGERLRSAWTRFLWHQFHDDLTGTSIPQAYEFSWNDELASANQFAGVLTSSISAIANLLDTRSSGIPLVVYNPLSAARRDAVEATVNYPAAAPSSIRVVDRATGGEVAVQILDRRGSQARILFLAEVPPVGVKVFEVKAGASKGRSSHLKISPSSLENERYAVHLDSNGDLSSIVDKEAGRELLKSPVRLELRDDPSPDKPAWRILFDTVNSAPREYVSGPRVRVLERGPARVALEIARTTAGSTFVQRVRLTEGGDRVEVENRVDWRSPNSLLKASFQLAAANARATYDLGLGAIERGNNTPEHYEVPAQKWADVTDAGGAFGVAILNDSKYGWDKPADDVLRLTLIHTPRPRAYPYQSSNDLGHHHFTYAISGHRGDWRSGRVPARAEALNQPLVAFQTTGHPGALGSSFSLLSLDDSTGQVAVRALKKAEEGDEIVLRIQEQYGRPARMRVKLAAAVQSAREINAAEEPIGALAVSGAELEIELKSFQPRTVALRLQPPAERGSSLAASPLPLPFNLDGVSTDANRADGDFDGKGQSIAGELFPPELLLGAVPFKLGPSRSGEKNLLVPRGQSIPLPEGSYDRLYFLAAAAGGDVSAVFTIAGRQPPRRVPVTIREWQGPIGQWDSRLKQARLLRESIVPPLTPRQSWTPAAIQEDMLVQFDPVSGTVSGIDQLQRGFIKRDEIAWIGTHRHSPEGNQAYVATYAFAYALDLPAGAREVRLPSDDRVRIFAMTAVREPHRATPAGPLYAADLSEPTAPVRLGRSRSSSAARLSDRSVQ